MQVEAAVPVESSKIWELLQRSRMHQPAGADSNEALTSAGISNCMLADSYARMVAAMFRDLKAAGHQERPLILELNSGPGQFAWQVMQRLQKYHWSEEEDGALAFTYLMTEPGPGGERQWSNNARLQALKSRGLVEFGRLALSGEPEVHVDGAVWRASDLAQRPLVIIANHVFADSPSALFRVQNGKLQKVQMGLQAEGATFDAAKPETYKLLTPTYVTLDAAGADTGSALLDTLVDQYVKEGRDLALPVPTVGFHFLSALLSNRSAPLLMLAHDSAYTRSSGLSAGPPFYFKENFKHYTNFHIFSELFKHHGGRAQFQRHDNPSLATAAFWVPTGNGAAVALERLRDAARAELQEAGPYDMSTVLELLRENVMTATFAEYFSWLQLSKLDPEIAESFLPLLIETLHRSDEGLNRAKARDLLLESLDLLLPTDEPITFDYGIAQWLLATKLNDDALKLLQGSLVEFGRTPERLYVYALALLRVERKAEARQVLDEAIAQRNDFAAARQVYEEHFQPAGIKVQTDEFPHFTVSARDPSAVAKAEAMLTEQGVVWFKDLLPRSYIDEVRRAFMERYEDHKRGELGKPNSVGNKRYTVPLRMRSPFGDPAMFAPELLMQMLTLHMGEKPIVNAYGGVITYPGANSQHVHREHPLLHTNDQYNQGLPAYAVNVLFPLVDITDELGGTQVWEGTHHIPADATWQGPSKVIQARQGDAVVLDYRVFHGGMPCTGKDLRPLLFITYSLPWFRDTLAFDNHDAVAISAAELAAMPESHRDYFRFARKIKEGDAAPAPAAPAVVAMGITVAA